MNTIILEKAQKLETVIRTIDRIVRDVIMKDQKWIAEANRKQLLAGKKATGVNMPSYVPGSIQPMAPGPIKLFEFGPFQEGIEPMFDDQGIELIGTEEKTGFLTAKYGEILGLTDKNIRELQKRSLPKILRKIEAILN